MNLTFNEISIRPFAESSHALKELFLNLGRTLKKLKEEYGVAHLVFPSDFAEKQVLPKVTVYEWLSGLQGLQKHQILSIIGKKPFSNEALEGHDEEIDSYIFSSEDLEIEEEISIGLGVAEICQTASISLDTHEFWRSNEIPFYILDYSTEETEPVSAPNCCLEELTDEFKAWIEDNTKVVLETTDIDPTTKPISLRDDHGKDVLTALAKRIRTSEYVVSIINSLPFNPTTSRFIRKCYSDGRVEIVLHWEDKGIGMVIQTTGRTYNETLAIAEILRQNYDR